jgi:hypothetical protein
MLDGAARPWWAGGVTEVLPARPDDLSNPAVADHVVAAAADRGPAPFRPAGSDLLRFGWASAVLDAHPQLLLPWAGSDDRTVRRAVMRSPDLTEEAAELVVATRRSGMHTLGANPAAPIELLARNPGAWRRRQAIDEVVPGGLAEVAASPDRPALVDLGSPTVDLAVARAAALDEAQALRLAARADPPIDPWVAAVLVERFGAPVWEALRTHAASGRLAAVAALSSRAAALRAA